MQPHLSWDLVEDVRQMLAFPFMVNALRAGTLVAVVAGAIGWVMVLRRQSFAGHTLAVVGFPAATGRGRQCRDHQRAGDAGPVVAPAGGDPEPRRRRRARAP